MNKGVVTVLLIAFLLLLYWLIEDSRLSYGHGMDDAVYFCASLILAAITVIVAVILFFAKSSFTVLNYVLIAIIVFIILQVTIKRGPVHPWNGKIFF